MRRGEAWPALQLMEWQDTYATLHMWTQIVGKVALALTPRVNHWWNVALRVTPRGLSTPTLAYERRALGLEFDFVDHRLLFKADDRMETSLALKPQSVAEFYHVFMKTLADLGVNVKIWPVPVEIPDPVPFAEDHGHASYDPIKVSAFFRVLVELDRLFTEFRAKFIGKCSPVHFFWGGFDLAVTRFSGRRAPARQGVIESEAYSHEVISHGFWPGSGATPFAALYAYAVPEPDGLRTAPIEPAAAAYSTDMGEFILPYEDVRNDSSPETAVKAFLETTYAAAADLAGWNRRELERT
jgi:hypothetical protein